MSVQEFLTKQDNVSKSENNAESEELANELEVRTAIDMNNETQGQGKEQIAAENTNIVPENKSNSIEEKDQKKSRTSSVIRKLRSFKKLFSVRPKRR